MACRILLILDVSFAVDISGAGLQMPGVIKPIMFTIEAKLIRKSLGRLADDDQRTLRHCIALLIG